MHLGRGGQAHPSCAAPSHCPIDSRLLGQLGADKKSQEIEQRPTGSDRHTIRGLCGVVRRPRAFLLSPSCFSDNLSVSLASKWRLRVILCLTNNQATCQRGFQTWGLFGSKTCAPCPALRLPHPSVTVLQVAGVAGRRGTAGETGRVIPRKQPT